MPVITRGKVILADVLRCTGGLRLHRLTSISVIAIFATCVGLSFTAWCASVSPPTPAKAEIVARQWPGATNVVEGSEITVCVSLRNTAAFASPPIRVAPTLGQLDPFELTTKPAIAESSPSIIPAGQRHLTVYSMIASKAGQAHLPRVCVTPPDAVVLTQEPLPEVTVSRRPSHWSWVWYYVGVPAMTLGLTGVGRIVASYGGVLRTGRRLRRAVRLTIRRSDDSETLEALTQLLAKMQADSSPATRAVLVRVGQDLLTKVMMQCAEVLSLSSRSRVGPAREAATQLLRTLQEIGSKLRILALVRNR